MSYLRINKRRYHFIYKTTCVITGNYYWGMHSTDDLEDEYIGSGRRLRRSIRKYGKENHIREIIEFCSSREDLAKREGEIVNLNEIAKSDCMNISLGGWGGFQHEEHRKKCCAAGGKRVLQILNKRHVNKLKEDPVYKENWKKKVRDSGSWSGNNFRGKRHSEETKQKMREKAAERKGDKNSQYGTCWITNGTENKKIKKTDELPEGWIYGRKIKEYFMAS